MATIMITKGDSGRRDETDSTKKNAKHENRVQTPAATGSCFGLGGRQYNSMAQQTNELWLST